MSSLAEKNEAQIQCRPFVKWAGGKTQLLSELLKRIPLKFNRYFEPFVGGGALFFAIQPKDAYLSDISAELINTYCVVRDEVGELIEELSLHHYNREYYYKVRNVDRNGHYATWNSVRKAARLIFLNKTCFNGLYRVNAKGHFNVPFGRYVNPTICDVDNLRACSMALKGTEILQEPFNNIVSKAGKGDFVYFDPPYMPLSNTANFTAYSSRGFGIDSQTVLRDVCEELDKKGVKFMLSNSSAPAVLGLYNGYNIISVAAGRAINSKGEKRGKVTELIVTNY